MIFLGYISAVFIGMLIGLIGGGGASLTVCVLVYLFHLSPVLATAYSLFTVGVVSFIGMISYIKNKQVDYKTILFFGIPALTGTFFARNTILPLMPDLIINTEAVVLSKNMGIMILFSLMVVTAAIVMIFVKTKEGYRELNKYRYSLLIAQGVTVGLLTGLAGVGGGFLIIPAMVFLAKLPMKKAVGTTLVIVTIKSLIGFMGDLNNHVSMNWAFLFVFTVIAIIGIFIGIFVSNYISGTRLKLFFGWFLLVLGFFILVQEMLNLN